MMVTLTAVLQTAWAYDFRNIAPSGDTLYFEFNYGNNNAVRVVAPGYDYDGYTRPTGDLVIPSTVNSYGITYSVTSIDYNAFNGCSGLTSVTIPNSVTSIGSSAFEGCTGLTSVTIPNSVTSIEGSAFYGCSGLTSVTIPNSVTTIGGATFAGCTGLTSVIIPNSVTTIEHYAFSGCSGLPSITIPNSVTTIGTDAFYGVINIVYYGTATDYYNWGAMYRNKYYESGFVYEDSTKTILLKYVGTDTNVTIPNSVTTIGGSAFARCSGLTSVTIPNSVDTIGAYAFRNTGLTSITIPENVRYVGYKAFGVDYDHSSSLTTVVWNAKNAFIDTDGMNSDIDSPFYGCSNISTVTFGDSVRVIPDYLFTDHTGLTSVTIGNSVTTIVGSAFAGCSGLTSVTIPNSVTTIGGSAFARCTGLTSVTIGNSVTTIGGSAFTNCTGLTSVTLPNSVDTIGAQAFYNTGLTSITIPENVRYIGSKAFGIDGYGNQSSSLTTVVWNAKNASIASDGWNYDSPFSGCSNISTVTFGDSVRVIPNYLFRNCTGLTSVTLPNSVTTIGNDAFYGCTGLTSVTLPNSVDTIGSQAFYNTGLTSITIPENVRYIGSEAFGIDLYGNQSSSLTTVVWNAKNVTIEFDDWGLYFHPFSGCNNISTVTFGDSVQMIPNHLFPSVSENITPNVYYGRDIESWINIERPYTPYDYHSIFGYRYYNLYINNQLVTNLDIPNTVDTIQAGTFYGCNSIQSITIPTQIEFIDNYAFCCWNLNSVTWNAINCNVEEPAFGECGSGNINSLVLGDSVQVIPNYAFMDFGITNVNLPNSLTSIGEHAFEGCANLASITIPSQVTTIGNGAFAECTNLRSITMEPTVPPTIYTGTFYGVGTGVSVNVPCGTVEDYSSAPFWFNFSNIRQSSECFRTITVISLNTSQGTVLGGGSYEYGSTATIAAIPKTGYQFYQWNDGDVSNPRSLVVSSDSSFIATFSSITTGGGLVHDTLYVDRYIYDTIYTTVHDTVSNNIYDTVIITNYDTIINTVYDTIITTINDTVTINQYDTIINTVYDTIINTVYDTITVSETYYTLDVTSTNSAQGIGAGSGSYPEGCVVTIVGLPMEGYRFVSWNDGNTDNPRQITISENASYVANFSTVDIEEAPEVQNLTVYPNPTSGVVTISEYDVNKVEIYDGVGKKVREYTSQRVLDLSDLSSGEYILRITLPQGVAVRRVVKR